MDLIIAGTRKIQSYNLVKWSVKNSRFNLDKGDKIISGTAKGPDKLGEKFAKEAGVVCDRYPAQWDEYGKSAGFIRNEEMAKEADACLALWDGYSSGTKNMIVTASSMGLDVEVFEFQCHIGLEYTDHTWAFKGWLENNGDTGFLKKHDKTVDIYIFEWRYPGDEVS